MSSHSSQHIQDLCKFLPRCALSTASPRLLFRTLMDDSDVMVKSTNLPTSSLSLKWCSVTYLNNISLRKRNQLPDPQCQMTFPVQMLLPQLIQDTNVVSLNIELEKVQKVVIGTGFCPLPNWSACHHLACLGRNRPVQFFLLKSMIPKQIKLRQSLWS